jgi:AcrR family transcriptional regulator
MTPRGGLGHARPADSSDSPARKAALTAARELLGEGGLAAVTMESVHARSHVSKATMYKYWPNRLCVAIDACNSTIRVPSAIDTGSAAGDLAEFVRSGAAFFTSPRGRLYEQLVAQASADEVSRAWLMQRVLAPRLADFQRWWLRLSRDATVAGDIDAATAFDLLVAPLFFRTLTGHSPLDRRAVRSLLKGVERALTRQPSAASPAEGEA